MILSSYFIFLHFFQVFKEMTCVHEVGPNSDFTGLSILSRGEDVLSNLHAITLLCHLNVQTFRHEPSIIFFELQT